MLEDHYVRVDNCEKIVEVGKKRNGKAVLHECFNFPCKF